MALIKCDECGHEISDKAACCIYCGNPIEHKPMSLRERARAKLPPNQVVLVMPTFFGYGSGATFMDVFVNGKQYVNGLVTGSSATFELEEAGEAIVRVLKVWRNGPYWPPENMDIHGFFEPGNRYELRCTKLHGRFFHDPFQSEFELVKVDEFTYNTLFTPCNVFWYELYKMHNGK